MPSKKQIYCKYLSLQDSQLGNKNPDSFFHQLYKWQVTFEFWEWNDERKARNIDTRLITTREDKRMAHNVVIFQDK